MAHYFLRTGEVADLDVKDVDLTGKVLTDWPSEIRTTFKVASVDHDRTTTDH